MFLSYTQHSHNSIILEDINLILILSFSIWVYHYGMTSILYKQTDYSKFTITEFLTEFKDNEFLDVLSREFLNQIKRQRGANEFGIESAREVVAAAIIKGFYRLPNTQ